MFENPRRGRQARNFTTNVPKILDLKWSSVQIFSENCRWVPLIKRSRSPFSIFQLPKIHSVCPPILHKPLFLNAPGSIAFSQEHFKTISYAKFGGQTECIMGNWRIVNLRSPNETFSIVLTCIKRSHGVHAVLNNVTDEVQQLISLFIFANH